MSHEYYYHRTGAERKALVKLIAETLGETAVYRKAPTFAYDIGFCHVDRNGTVFCPEETDPVSLTHLIDTLKTHGFVPENTQENSQETETNAENTVTDEAGVNAETTMENAVTMAGAKKEIKGMDSTINPESVTENPITKNPLEESENLADSITIKVPNEGFSEHALLNLQKIIASKEPLLKKSLNVSELPPIQVTEETVGFPWFSVQNIPGEMDAYARLVSAICNMAKKQKRVMVKTADLQNEKFAMRIFLIRLGFIGDEYKSARKILLRNLTGNGSWKGGHRPETPKSGKTTPEPDTVAPENGGNSTDNHEQDHQPEALETKEGGEPYTGTYDMSHVPKP